MVFRGTFIIGVCMNTSENGQNEDNYLRSEEGI